MFPMFPYNILIMASTLRLVGEILIAIVLFSLHSHVMKEEKTNAERLAVMSRERLYIVVGLTAIFAAYAVELYARARGYV